MAQQVSCDACIFLRAQLVRDVTNKKRCQLLARENMLAALGWRERASLLLEAVVVLACALAELDACGAHHVSFNFSLRKPQSKATYLPASLLLEAEVVLACAFTDLAACGASSASVKLAAALEIPGRSPIATP